MKKLDDPHASLTREHAEARDLALVGIMGCLLLGCLFWLAVATIVRQFV